MVLYPKVLMLYLHDLYFARVLNITFTPCILVPKLPFMPCHISKVLLTLIILNFIFSIPAIAQNVCPPNLDFENGNFLNWVCKTGTVSTSGGQNTPVLSPSGPTFGRHTIIPYSDTTKDRYGGFPVLCPNGSGYSVKLGNDNSGTEAEGVFYTYNIPVTASNFSILYQYAVVFENPGHKPEEQPRFRARVINLTDNDTIGCVSFDFTSGANLPGFKVSGINSEVLYKDWTPVSLNLSGYAGKTIQVELITSDCTLGAHFGYAYVDVNSQCDGSIVGTTICVGDTTVNLLAPYGYQSYAWYSDNTFSQILGTGQTLFINPAPNVGRVFPVIVTPFPGFGCTDTVYANIKTDTKPISNAGADATVCRLLQVPLGTTPNPANFYYWTPTNLVTNPIIANPIGFNNTLSPQQFIVKTTTRSSGCFSYDTVVIRSVSIDTTLLVTGKINYCTAEIYNNSLTVSNLSSGIQWLKNNIPIAGETTRVYIPVVAGAYRAKFVQNGCTDTTRTVTFSDHVSPVARYTVNKNTQCVTNNSFVFTNGSTIPNPDLFTVLWNFGDGTASQTTNAVKAYNLPGTYNLKLIATSNYNCIDSVSGIIKVIANAAPDFTQDVNCTNAPVNYINKTAENGSLSVSYLWDFNNGPGSVLKNPPPLTYPNPGTYNISLQTSAVGCEAEKQTISKKVIIYEPKPGIRYPDRTVPSTYSSQIFTRWGIGDVYNWSPAIQLSNPRIKSPYFKAINDVEYLIAITDINKCITTDTIKMYVLTKKGWYMPNAFTPNNDGLNDIIRPYLQGMVALKKFSIYNRLGNLIFSTNRDGEAWNGKYQGIPLEAGTFVWMIEYIDMDNKNAVQKGTFLLIR